MNYSLDFFNQDTGQLQVTLHGFGSFSIDVPIEGGKYISGEPLRNYIAGLVPTWQLERIEAVNAKPTGSDEIHAMCLGKPEYPVPSYSELRRLAYPSFEEYIDGIVKGDLVQQEAYLQHCRDVKTKYPKPEPVSEEVLKSRREL